MQKEMEKETKMSCPNALNPLSPSQFPSDFKSSFWKYQYIPQGVCEAGGKAPPEAFLQLKIGKKEVEDLFGN